MKIFICLLISFVLTASFSTAQVQTNYDSGKVIIYNGKVKLSFNLYDGLFSIQDNKKEMIVQDAFFQLGGLESKDSCGERKWSVSEISDEIGHGKALTIRIAFNNYADILWQVILYDQKDFLVFNMGVANDTKDQFRIMSFDPLRCDKLYYGLDNSINYKVLDGNDGGNVTSVKTDKEVMSFNNLLLRFGLADTSHILVAGGITYHEFDKYIQVNRENKAITLRLHSEDPVGKLVDAGGSYWLQEKYYVCFENSNPFEALEKYASVLKQAQNIHLNYYDFPTECLWYASYYNRDTSRKKFNDTKGAAEEMKNAIQSGITKYTRVAIRLVPDAYGPNNQQGWWDDQHWAMWGDKMSAEGANYVAPYLTTSSWCRAITDRGGLPFTYFQSDRRSEDFVKQHPGWMLFNDPYRVMIDPKRELLPLDAMDPDTHGYIYHWWSDNMLWGYDFTDTGFIHHMKGVYAHLKKAGIKGIMFDYPDCTAWAYEGGFDNKYATTAGAYRKMFQLAYDGLGHDAYINERNIVRGSDITLGLVASQRVWADNDIMTPAMVGRCGLRWYKNRVVLNYDMDAKDPDKGIPAYNKDGIRAMLTMCYVASGRFLLGRSFSQLTPHQIHDISRIFPFPSAPQSARPVDAFTTAYSWPRIYDLEVNDDWHRLTFYNYNLDSLKADDNNISVSLGKSLNEGGLQLDPTRLYYIYDFWNDRFVGKYKGTDTLSQQLRPGEARMMSIHAVEDYPQFISTDRHIMQGYLDLHNYRWLPQEKVLEGTSDIVANDLYKVVIATNGSSYKDCKVSNGKCNIRMLNPKYGLIELSITASANEKVNWEVHFR